MDKFLEERRRILEERGEMYGEASDSCTALGFVWTGMLQIAASKVPLPAWFVLLMHAGIKLCRLAHDPSNRDSWLDLANYVDLAHEAYEKDLRGAS